MTGGYRAGGLASVAGFGRGRAVRDRDVPLRGYRGLDAAVSGRWGGEARRL